MAPEQGLEGSAKKIYSISFHCLAPGKVWVKPHDFVASDIAILSNVFGTIHEASRQLLWPLALN